MRPATVERLLKRHRIRRFDAVQVLGRLRQPAVATAAGTVDVTTTHLQVVVEHLRLVNRQIKDAEKRLDHLTEQLATATPEADGVAATMQRDVTILRSLPGPDRFGGRVVIATLLARASEALQRRDYHALRCLCGVAPVTKRSGKSKIVLRRQAAHNRLASAAYHWARVAVQRDPRSRQKYAAPRARDHGHARALRSVADRLLAVACAMLAAGTSFDPAHPSKVIDGNSVPPC